MKIKSLRAGGLLAAGAVSGAILAGTIGASAASSSSTPAATSYAGTPAGAPAYGVPANGAPAYGGAGFGSSTGVRPGGQNPDETVLTGTDAQQATAAAKKAVPGGTVNRVETDSGDAAYEAHMTKADGSLVTVKLDKNFAVTAVEDGMGK